MLLLVLGCTACATCPTPFDWGIGPGGLREFPVSMDALVALSRVGSFERIMAELGPAPSGLPSSRRNGMFLTPDQYYVGYVYYEGWPTHTVRVEMPGPGVGPCYPIQRALELAGAKPEPSRSRIEYGEVRTYIRGSGRDRGCLEQITFSVAQDGLAE